MKTFAHISESPVHSRPAFENQSGNTFFGNNQPFFSPSTIQPKLTIGQPNDKYEQEADRVADKVVRSTGPEIQAKCVGCEEEEAVQAKFKIQKQEEEEEMMQMKGEEEEEAMQAKFEIQNSTVGNKGYIPHQRKKIGEDERIFGSVTAGELAELLQAEGLEVDKKHIQLLEEVKKVGVYQAQAKLHSDVVAKFKVWVVAE